MSNRIIRVLVVDDSAFARKVIREVLSRDPDIEVVGIARDGLDALEKIAELDPDVVTLDLVMPDLDGMGVLRALPHNSKVRVVVVSSSASDTELAIRALQSGAVDVVTKPTALATDRLYEISTDLVAKVKAAAMAQPRLTREPSVKALSALKMNPGKSETRLVVIGTSTGGPQALTELFRSLPEGLPVPIAIALHIPAGYTGPLAKRISSVSAVTVVEAADGMELAPGRAVIAPGGMHLRIVSRLGRFYAAVSREPADSIYYPSVNLLFKSAAESAGAGALALILTGMGNDGTDGSKAIREAGGRVLAESASSCIVYGMPRSVIEAGYANAEAPLEKSAELLVKFISE